ncbi:MAG TPA: FAD-linked oxidase C-terminal domain-containing protein [Pyrinomonadaceae bacterium]|nr:FAD-linked oxidase C-terminal domain-containing protein [Pyrinomonadaceae bacterium]
MAAPEQHFAVDDAFIYELRDIVGDENVLSDRDELLVYECDGLPQHKHLPRAVVFPNSTEETADVLTLLHENKMSFAPRGAGTGLSGGALAIDRGVVIELARMRKILGVDTENRIARVQTGLVNAHLSRVVAPYGLYYVPDPSSQPSCTIGGNIAENAGGIHCLKYGTTTDHVIGARVVLSNGSVVDLDRGAPGYDLIGTFVGSEGTFGIATEATLKLSPIPPAVRTLLADFLDVDQASRAVSEIIAAGMLPAALEMMDQEIIRAVEASVFAAGLPIDAQAVLLVELDGIEAGLDDEAEHVKSILSDHGARSVRLAVDENERKKLWAARKGAFGAVGRLLPDVMIQDAVVPRSRLPEVLAETYRISAKYKIKLANVFHAGDGNLHPLICFDLRRGDDLEKVRQAGREIMETCVRAGGSITGEHGVGLDKSGYLPLIFSEDDMDAMLRVRAAFDPSGLCNPGKIIPLPRGCGEARAVATQSVSEPGAIATGSSDSFAEKQLTRPSRARFDLVPTAPGSDTGAKSSLLSETKTRTNALVAERLNEGRVANEFKTIVGPENIRRVVDTDLADRLEFRSQNNRALVISPANADEVADVIEVAAREDLAVIPAGGSSSLLEVGNWLARADVILRTRRMNKSITHEPADLVATAQAGITLREFQNQLCEQGQWLPIDPPDDGNATLGGVIATGLSGPHELGYGPLRSFVIGMRVVLSDGTPIKCGGNVVKNVAGYDLCKLFTGSFGTLGVITEVIFKLRPLPAETRTIVASGPHAVLMSMGRAILRESFPVALELLSPLLATRTGIAAENKDCVLMIRFAASARGVVVETANALKRLRDQNLVCVTHDEDGELWQRLSEAGARAGDNLVWTITTLPTDFGSTIDEVDTLARDEASHVDLQWQAALGLGRIRAMARAPAYHRDSVRALEGLRQRAENLGGRLIIEKAPFEIKQEIDSWGDFGSASELMKRIKQQLDSQNIMSPGRFFAT